MTTLNPDRKTTVAALLALLDAAAALLQLPPDVRRQAIGEMTIQVLLEDAKALDRLISGDLDRMNGMNKIHKSHESYLSHSTPETPPTAPNGPKRRKINPRPTKRPGRLETLVLGPSASATREGDASGDEGGNTESGIKNKELRIKGDQVDPPNSLIPNSVFPVPDSAPPAHPSNRLSLAEFDKLCRAEMKRLSVDGRIPNAKLWDSERSPHLPTLSAVMMRYKVRSLVGLAEALGMQPPLTSRNYTINANGASIIYGQEKEDAHAPTP